MRYLQLLLGIVRALIVLWPLWLLQLLQWCCWVRQNPIARRQLRVRVLAHALLRNVLRCCSIIAVTAILPLAVHICRTWLRKCLLHLIAVLQLTVAPMLRLLFLYLHLQRLYVAAKAGLHTLFIHQLLLQGRHLRKVQSRKQQAGSAHTG